MQWASVPKLSDKTSCLGWSGVDDSIVWHATLEVKESLSVLASARSAYLCGRLGTELEMKWFHLLCISSRGLSFCFVKWHSLKMYFVGVFLEMFGQMVYLVLLCVWMRVRECAVVAPGFSTRSHLSSLAGQCVRTACGGDWPFLACG